MKQKILKMLENVIDPETGINVVEMGMIKGIKIKDKKNVEIVFTPTSPFCPMMGYLINQIKQAAERVKEVNKVDVKVVF